MFDDRSANALRNGRADRRCTRRVASSSRDGARRRRAGCTLQEAAIAPIRRGDRDRRDARARVEPGHVASRRSSTARPTIRSRPSVYRGLAILTHTRDSLPAYVGGNLNCTSCHLDEGRRAERGAARRRRSRAIPKYMDRSGAVVPIEDRVNYCFTRSLAGSKLPPDSREMQDIVAYLAFISTRRSDRVSTCAAKACRRCRRSPATRRAGATLFVDNCARCHGNNGAGMGPIPALWGPKSFSIGASMARQERAASFIRHNMPFDQPGIAHRPAGVRRRRVHHVDAASRLAGQGNRLAQRRRAGRRAVRHEGPQGVPSAAKCLPRTTNAAGGDRRRAGVGAHATKYDHSENHSWTRHARSAAAR